MPSNGTNSDSSSVDLEPWYTTFAKRIQSAFFLSATDLIREHHHHQDKRQQQQVAPSRKFYGPCRTRPSLVVSAAAVADPDVEKRREVKSVATRDGDKVKTRERCCIERNMSRILRVESICYKQSAVYMALEVLVGGFHVRVLPLRQCRSPPTQSLNPFIYSVCRVDMPCSQSRPS